jgi:hypothetical protein
VSNPQSPLLDDDRREYVASMIRGRIDLIISAQSDEVMERQLIALALVFIADRLGPQPLVPLTPLAPSSVKA